MSRRGVLGSLRRDWNRALGRQRGKCRYGPSHESVRLAGDFWLGESSNSFGCSMAERDTCPVCYGRGVVDLTPEELAAEQADVASKVREKQCKPCHGVGTLPGAHWPWRHDHPGPVPLELL